MSLYGLQRYDAVQLDKQWKHAVKVEMISSWESTGLDMCDILRSLVAVSQWTVVFPIWLLLSNHDNITVPWSVPRISRVVRSVGWRRESFPASTCPTASGSISHRLAALLPLRLDRSPSSTKLCIRGRQKNPCMLLIIKQGITAV